MSDILDMAVVEELLSLTEDGDPELLVDLIEMFLQDGPAKLESIVVGTAEQDWERVERAAHSLKGSAGNLGARLVQDDCDVLQVACRQGRITEVQERATALRGNFEVAFQALRDLRDRYS